MKAPTHFVGINPYSGKGELSVLFAGHAQTAPLHQVGPQVLDYHLWHFVLDGYGEFHCRGEGYQLTAQDSFFIFPGELVSYASANEEPWRYRWVGFKGQLVEQWLSTLGISAHKPVVRLADNHRIPALLHQIAQVLHKGEPSCDMQAGGLMRLVFAELMHQTAVPYNLRETPCPEGKHQINQAIRWLTLQYSQPVSIEQMAHTLGYHRTHLSKLFKQHTGLSPMAFLHKIRMERAKLLLLEPLTVEQVASSVGFADALYFSKQFRKWEGCSPSEYRQKALRRERFDCMGP